MTDLTLYDYAASANCLKARVLLAQLGRPYRRVGVDIFAGDTAAPEYRRRNPLGAHAGARARRRHGDRRVGRHPALSRRGHGPAAAPIR